MPTDKVTQLTVAASSMKRGLRVLQEVATSDRPISLAEIAQRLNLPKPTVHRLCAQLIESEFIARDVDERTYVVGPKLHRLALDTLNHGLLRAQRHEVLAALVAGIGETCNFTTLDGAQVLYVDRVEASWPLRLTLEVGAHVPLHCTASGKLLLAYLPLPKRRALIEAIALPRHTPNTIVEKSALYAACETIAKNGFATDDCEFIEGLLALAVPVFDSDGNCRATIAVHGLSARLDMKAALAKLPIMQDAARKMGELLR